MNPTTGAGGRDESGRTIGLEKRGAARAADGRLDPEPAAAKLAVLASVIDTCRQRGQSPWRTLERAIAARRAGLPQ